MSSTQSLWKDILANYAMKLDRRNADTRLLVDLSIPENNQVKSISNLVSEKQSIVMYYQSKKMRFIHSVTDLAGGILFPASKVTVLDGFKDQAFPVIISNSSISKTSDIEVPKLEELIGLDTVADIKLSATQEYPNEDERELLSTHPFSILPPFLWQTAMEIKDKESPANVFQVFNRRIVEYSKENEGDVSLSKERLQEGCKRLLQFLWSAEAKKLSSLDVGIESEDEEVMVWCKSTHEKHPGLHQSRNPTATATTTVISPPPTHLNITSTLLQNSIDQISKLAPNDLKKKSFNKLHELTKNMILNACSPDGMSKGGSPPKECLDFFKARSSGDAKLIFLKSLKSRWNCNIQVTSGVIMSLYSGNFLRKFVEAPSNFSPFSFPKKSFLGGNPEKESLFLQLKELSGEGLSNAEIRSTLNQELVVPPQVDFMKYNIENMLGACCFFFSHYSILPQRLAMVRDHIRNNLEVYEATQYHNKAFAAEFLFSLDTRIQIWLQQCEKESDRDMVDNELIDFSDDLNRVLMRTFSITLPKEIKEKIEGTTTAPSQSENNLTSHMGLPKGKRRKLENGHSSQLENEGKTDSWIVDQAEYDKRFRHNSTALSKRPKFRGCFMCHRWHLKGYCFKNCNNKCSHIPSSSIPQDVKEKYESWSAECSNN